MYAKIFLKGPVRLFRKHFGIISENSSRKNCVVIKIFKKQVRIKELENRDEAKRKIRSYFILKESFIKKGRKLKKKREIRTFW